MAAPNLTLKKLMQALRLPTAGKNQDQFAEAVAASGNARRVITGVTPFLGGSATVPRIITNGPGVIGYDALTGTVYAASNTNLYRSTDGGVSFSNPLGLPAGVTNGFTLSKLIRAGAYLWCWGVDATSGKTGVYRATATTGNTVQTWSAQLLTLTAGNATGFGPCLSTDGTYIYAAEYGLPSVTGGPSIWRIRADSATGTDWVQVYGPMVGTTHIHAIEPDPYMPGHVWMTCGDSVANCIYRSTDYGLTWTAITPNSAYQSVQISFGNPALGAEHNHIYLAPDTTKSALIVVNRTTLKVAHGAHSYHQFLPVPNAGGFQAGTTSASTTITTFNSIPYFSNTDIGRHISGTGIPDGATITAVASSTSATISIAATATNSAAALLIDRPEMWNINCFWGAVDPATGVYYFISNDNAGASPGGYPRYGLFYVPYLGGPVCYLDTLPANASGGVIIGGGRVYAGRVGRALLPLQSIPNALM